MFDYKITETGYRITYDGKDLYVQEGKYATVYPGETMEERAQNHIADLTREPEEAAIETE